VSQVAGLHEGFGLHHHGNGEFKKHFDGLRLDAEGIVRNVLDMSENDHSRTSVSFDVTLTPAKKRRHRDKMICLCKFGDSIPSRLQHPKSIPALIERRGTSFFLIFLKHVPHK
jgi:hypothetical protein